MTPYRSRSAFALVGAAKARDCVCAGLSSVPRQHMNCPRSARLALRALTQAFEQTRMDRTIWRAARRRSRRSMTVPHDRRGDRRAFSINQSHRQNALRCGKGLGRAIADLRAASRLARLYKDAQREAGVKGEERDNGGLGHKSLNFPVVSGPFDRAGTPGRRGRSWKRSIRAAPGDPPQARR